MRIEYAQKLLKESDMTVNKVAEASGYANTSSFIRAFKKLTGNTPGEYRKE